MFDLLIMPRRHGAGPVPLFLVAMVVAGTLLGLWFISEASFLVFLIAVLLVSILTTVLLKNILELQFSFRRRTRSIVTARSKLLRQQQGLLKLISNDNIHAGDLSTSFKLISKMGCEILNASVASIWLFDSQQNDLLQCLESYDSKTKSHGTLLSALRKTEHEEHFLKLSEKRVLVSDHKQKSPFASSFSDPKSNKVKATVEAPFFHAGKLIGVLCLCQKKTPRFWTSDEQSFVSSLADIVSIAFHANQRKIVETALREKSLAIEASAEGIGIIDDKHHYRYVNRAFADIYGFASSDEIVGLRCQDFYAPRELERVAQLMTGLNKTGKLRFEVQSKRRSGEIFPQEISLTAIPGGGFICFARDVSERSKSQRETEDMALITRMSPFPIVHFDQDQRILTANPAAQEILGIDTGSHQSLRTVIPALKRLDRSFFARENVTSFTSGIAEKYFQLTLKSSPGSDKIPPSGYLFAIDISSLKGAQEKIVESERFLRNVIDADPNFIFIKDRRGRFVLVNDAVCQAYGTNNEELIGKSDADFNPNKDEVLHYREIDLKVINENRPIYIPEEKITDSEGNLRWLSTIKKPFLTSSGEQMVLGVASDITERKRLESQLLQSQKMEAVGQLAGGIAHDFNNLLTGILGHIALLKLENENNPSILEIAELIEQASYRASELTHKLLGFARKGKHQNTPIDIHNSIKETLSLVESTFEKNIFIERDLQAKEASVRGDPVQLQQVFLNLAINARDAMNGQATGRLKVSTQVVWPEQVSVAPPGTGSASKYLEVTFSDTGHGIPNNLKEKVFEPFFSTKTAEKGTGMGLAMVYGIVKNHGGFVLLEDREGGGAVFKIFLPLLQQEEALLQPMDLKRPVKGIGTILVVDDHDIIREVADKMLTSLGYKVLTAEDGVEAVKKYQEFSEQIDLILMDLVMPRMGARECYHRIRQLNPQIKVIVSTGYGKNNLVQELLDSGVIDFIQKPYRLHELSEVVDRSMRNKPAALSGPHNHGSESAR